LEGAFCKSRTSAKQPKRRNVITHLKLTAGKANPVRYHVQVPFTMRATHESFRRTTPSARPTKRDAVRYNPWKVLKFRYLF
jgi:hypothetical protein